MKSDRRVLLAATLIAAASAARASVDWGAEDPVLQMKRLLAENPPAVAAARFVDMPQAGSAKTDDLSPEDGAWVQEMSALTEGMSVSMLFAIVEEQAAYLEKYGRKFEELRRAAGENRLIGMPDPSIYENIMLAVVQLKGALAQSRTELAADPLSARRHLTAARSQAARLYALSRPISTIAHAPRWGGPEIKRQAVILHVLLPAIEREMSKSIP